ncbi:K+-transporting ATPase ATPase C chain [Comamonas sp. BIGb0124]|uniref:potassium-transporting ATPase subunit KdpC n=1 Tax=Comamonas sp. BIGb0124 TaxID=2485130 RepID=UPI000FB19A6B|nr:potassium-transporting ATPase subunit KdpC [Comamonas sp. BIGb0124]ROR18653.1 K+-transporting ATPase ATPase C chain [Comamonas sp. BIGb0124]
MTLPISKTIPMPEALSSVQPTTPPATAPSAPGLHDGGALRASAVLAVLSLALIGLGYNLAGVGLGQWLFPHQANGSLVQAADGRVIGSALVAQPFADARYFMPRPSAAAFDPMAAAGSNQARSNPDLPARVQLETDTVARRENIAPAQVPRDLVTQSGSGLDPHIGPEAAEIQVERVARARAVPPARIRELLAQHIERPWPLSPGAARVNVLLLNAALDQHLAPSPSAAGASR